MGLVVQRPETSLLFQTEIKPEAKRKEACTRIRLKIFPYILKARESGSAVPYNILVTMIKF